MKRIIILILTAFISVTLNIKAQKNISYFRSDGKFNQIKLKDQTQIRHSHSKDGIPEITFTDWLYGDVSIPLSALDSCVIRDHDIPVLRFSFPDFPEAESLWEKDLYLSATLDIE